MEYKKFVEIMLEPLTINDKEQERQYRTLAEGHMRLLYNVLLKGAESITEDEVRKYSIIFNAGAFFGKDLRQLLIEFEIGCLTKR